MPNGPNSTSVFANGINGVTGRYDIAPLEIGDFARALKAESTAEPAPSHVIERGQRLQQKPFSRSLPWGVEPHDIPRAGWAVVFHAEEDPKVRDALKKLIQHRRDVIAADTRVKELVYNTGESASAWLARHDVSWHNVTPEKVPYYLLFAGSPSKIPFEVTHELDSDYAVGLLHFDTADDYARYAGSVVD